VRVESLSVEVAHRQPPQRYKPFCKARSTAGRHSFISSIVDVEKLDKAIKDTHHHLKKKWKLKQFLDEDWQLFNCKSFYNLLF
jgi:hypothetical protein